MYKRNRTGRNIDWFTVILFAVIAVLGWLNIYSAAYSEAHPNIFDFREEYGRQAIWLGVSAVLAMLCLALEGRFIIYFSYHFFALTLFLLVFVLIFGKEVNGAKSWFGVGAFGIQPSEFAKIGVSLAMAKYLTTPNIKLEDLRTKLIAGIIVAIPAFLILLQPDAGTTLVFISFVLVLYREGLSGSILLFGLLSIVTMVLSLRMKDTSIQFFGNQVNGQIVIGIVFTIIALFLYLLIRYFVYKRNRRRGYVILIAAYIGSIALIGGTGKLFDKLQPHQQKRIANSIGLLDDRKGVGYNVHQAMSAIGSGGMWGKGYHEGTLSNDKYQHVPMQSTDFIFCSIGEEWGFVGSTVVIVLFMVLLVRIILLAERQRSRYTQVYAYSVAGIIFFHLMINVGMAIGLAPVIGIPLPFFSYGGSSLMAFTVLIFILLRLDAERMDVLR